MAWCISHVILCANVINEKGDITNEEVCSHWRLVFWMSTNETLTCLHCKQIIMFSKWKLFVTEIAVLAHFFWVVRRTMGLDYLCSLCLYIHDFVIDQSAWTLTVHLPGAHVQPFINARNGTEFPLCVSNMYNPGVMCWQDNGCANKKFTHTCMHTDTHASTHPQRSFAVVTASFICIVQVER